MRTARGTLTAGVCGMLLAIGSAAQAAGYAELRAKAETSFAHAKEAGKTAADAAAPEKPYEPTAADKRRGLVVYLPPIGRHFRDRSPAAGEVGSQVSMAAAQGETESCLLAVHALRHPGIRV